MKAYYDSMEYTNVVSSKYQIPLSMKENLIQSAGEDFLNKIGNSGMEPQGTLTYFLEPLDQKNVWITYMIAVKELILNEGNTFRMDSYYSQEQMVCVRAKQEELRDFNKVLECMEEFSKKELGILYGPIYYVASQEEKEQYLLLKRGILFE